MVLAHLQHLVGWIQQEQLICVGYVILTRGTRDDHAGSVHIPVSLMTGLYPILTESLNIF